MLDKILPQGDAFLMEFIVIVGLYIISVTIETNIFSWVHLPLFIVWKQLVKVITDIADGCRYF